MQCLGKSFPLVFACSKRNSLKMASAAEICRILTLVLRRILLIACSVLRYQLLDCAQYE